MKKRLLMAIALMLALGMGLSALLLNVSTANASGGPISGVFHFKGQAAEVMFSSTEGDVVTNVYIFTSDTVISDPTGKTAPQTVYVDIGQYNAITYEPIMMAFNQVTPTTLQFGKQLDSATVTATVPVTTMYYNAVDGTWTEGTSMDLSVNVTWTGFGDLMSDHGTWHSHTPTVTINQHSHGTSRSADASGSVMGGTINFTPLAGQGDLQSVKSGTVQIVH